MAEETQNDKVEDLPGETGGKGGSWLPIIVALVLVPVLAIAVTEFVLIPRITAKVGAGAHGDGHGDEHAGLATVISGGPGAPVSASGGGGGGHGGGGGDHAKTGGKTVQLYHFETMKTNLSNPSTTLIIVKFSVKGSAPNFMTTIDQYQVQLNDATLKVLSLLTRVETQSPGIQNVVKNDLITRFNQVLGSDLVEDLFFVDFVTQ